MRLRIRSFHYLALFITLSVTTAGRADGVTHMATASAGKWRPQHSAYALVSARQQTILSLPFAVRILTLPAEPGTKVEAGQTLATFYAPQLRRNLAEWQLARHELALTRQQLKVLRRNRQEKTITQRELLDGEQAAAKAKASADLAWQTLAAGLDFLNATADADRLAKEIDASGVTLVAKELGRLRAPFEGVVIARHSSEGEQLAAGAPILELESLDRVYLDVGVAESALTDWQHGKTYWPGISGKITLKRLPGIPRLDPDSGLWLLRFEAQNPDSRLQDDIWVEVKHLGETQSVVWLPAAAVVSRNGKHWVMVQAGEQYQPVEIQAGPVATDGRIPVTAGIKPGTRVVIEGAYELLYRDLKDLIKFVD